MGPASVLDLTGAALLTLWAVTMWTAVAVLAYANRGPVRRWQYRTSLWVIALGVIGQIGHVQEHVAQAGYWVLNPEAPPWMTPWGHGLARGMGRVDTTTHALGMEILHLTGNLIFLAGLAGILVITRRALGTRSRRWARTGAWLQGLHCVEHVMLTVSVALGSSQSLGMSTWFGLLEPGPGLWTYRIWWHFLANVMGSVIFGVALCLLWRERRGIAGSHGTAVEPGTPGGRHARQPSQTVTADCHSGDETMLISQLSGGHDDASPGVRSGPRGLP